MKKNIRTCAVLLLVLGLLVMTAGCAAENTPGGQTVTDMGGRVVELPEKTERIVVLSAADCEILYAIGAGDLVVGRGTYCNWPAETESVPLVGSGSATNIEEILALTPDVVVMAQMDQTPEQAYALENAGVTVVQSDADTLADVYEAITLMGAVTGKTDEAADLIDEMQATFAEIEEKAPQETGKTIYFEVSPLQYGLWTAGTGTFMDEIAQMLGLRNTFEDVAGWGEVSQEEVIARNPDYIVTTTMYFGEGPLPTEEILGRSGWEGISAVQNETVFLMDSDMITRPGPRLMDAAEALYEMIYE